MLTAAVESDGFVALSVFDNEEVSIVSTKFPPALKDTSLRASVTWGEKASLMSFCSADVSV